MTFRDWFLFISTFVVAVLCGMYLYFTTFIPAYVANPVVQDISRSVTAGQWQVNAETYGGCAMTAQCPSYSLRANGTLRYQPGGDTAVQEMTVPRSLRTAVEEAFTATDLAARSRSVDTTCQSYVDGIDYSIIIEQGDRAYRLDTCETDLTHSARLTQVIEDVFAYAEDPAGYNPKDQNAGAEPTRRGLGGYLERLLDETFDYDD